MNPAHIIARKRDGEALLPEEIGELIRGYAAGDVPDYQMSAWAMAVCWQSMSREETVALTRAMLESGAVLECPDTSLRVDKHSTGGIGDKTSFIIAPLLACCGLRVPMISGRGLGATGGTLDKLESIPGVRTNLSREEAAEIVDRVGCVITGATADLVPADRKLYALRDVTGTISSIPLITASILSKKLAERLSALVLDVKFGSGAFMKTRDRARALAQSMVEVAAGFGLKATALLTDMNQPNGRLAGNAVEIDESLDILAGKGPDDLRELILALCAEVLLMKSSSHDAADARATLASHLDSGRALRKFSEMIAAQGGDLDAPRPRAPAWTLAASGDGFVTAIDAERLGLAIVEMGGGRKKVGDSIDHSVGLEVFARIGDRIRKGEPLLTVFASEDARSRALPLLQSSFTIDPEPPIVEPLIAERIVATTDQPLAGGLTRATTSRAKASIHPAAEGSAGVDRRQELIDRALQVQKRAHAPYSGFHVGAALLASSGKIYSGTNVENSSYGLTICAERSAFTAAISAGESQFTMLVVASPEGAAPCGACRQFAAEFAPDLPIVLIDSENPAQPVAWRLDELLPAQFAFPRSRSDQHAGNAGGHETSQGTAEHRAQP